MKGKPQNGKAEKPIHSGHRDRMRERCRKNGLGSFADHEVLELLLSYAIPRRDTNDLAHRLIKRFGGLRGIGNASVDELAEVEGIGEKSAVLIKLSIEFVKRLVEEKRSPSMVYDTVSKLAEYCVTLYMGVENECLSLLLFNNRMNLIDCVRVSEGSVNSSPVPVRRMTETAIQRRASSVVLAHNHPNGVAYPSPADLDITDSVNDSFRTVGVQLLEHIVVADNSFYPIMEKRFGRMRRSPYSGKVESAFFDHFYDVAPEAWVAPPIFELKTE